MNSNVVSTNQGPIKAAIKAAVPALAFAFGLAAASAGHATTVILDNGTMDHPRTVNISGIGNVYAAPVLFDGVYGATPFTDLVAFCVDVYHHITLANYTPDLVYTDVYTLTTDSNFVSPITLTTAQVTQIGRLVNFGTDVFYGAPQGNNAQKNARWDQLAGVQGAIWQVVSGRNVTSADVALDSLINNLGGASYLNYVGAYGPVSSDIKLLTPLVYPARAGTQSFAIAYVPEPATWAMMIIGFGAAGTMIRRRRVLARTAA